MRRVIKRWIVLNVLGVASIMILGFFEWSYVVGWVSGALIGSLVVERI